MRYGPMTGEDVPRLQPLQPINPRRPIRLPPSIRQRPVALQVAWAETALTASLPYGAAETS